jgi:hypothetical protein
MARNQELQERRAEKIRDYYTKLDSILEFGVKKHTGAWCVAKTADFFDLRPKTIERYIYQ